MEKKNKKSNKILLHNQREKLEEALRELGQINKTLNNKIFQEAVVGVDWLEKAQSEGLLQEDGVNRLSKLIRTLI